MTAKLTSPEQLEARRKRRAASAKRWRELHPGEQKKKNAKWVADNPEKHKAGQARRKYRRYNLTVEQFESMLASQNGVCAICKLPNKNGNRLVIDHNHKTNINRGLLCGLCNIGLGSYLDNPELLREAANYLEYHINGE